MQKETYVVPELQKQEPLKDLTAWGDASVAATTQAAFGSSSVSS